MKSSGQWAVGSGQNGQSTMEYILIVIAVLAVVIVGARTIIGPAVTKTMTESSATIQNAATTLSSKIQ